MLFCGLEKDDYVAKTAAAIRKEGKCLKDGMPRPHQPSDLEPEKFKTPCKLNEFLTYLLTVKGENEISSRSAATFSSRRVETPKSLLLPSVIKTQITLKL